MTFAWAESVEVDLPVDGDASLSTIAANAVRTHRVPALGIAVVTATGPVVVGVAGYRRRGSTQAVLRDDLWHLGSCTKMMTAALIGRLIDEGAMAWTDRVIRETATGPAVHPAWRNITLEHLLAHRAGLAANLGWPRFSSRQEVLDKCLSVAPPQPVGAFAYSNTGYVLAGAWCERVTGVSWENLLRTKVWQPLGITNAGFGVMGTRGETDQPWGHFAIGIPAGNGPDADNPAVMGPAGTVHMSLHDWGLFVADQLRGAQGRAGLLKAETVLAMQQPWPGGDYAKGWSVIKRNWAKGAALHHAGSNTMNYAVVWMAPALDRAFLVTCNQGDVGPACDAVIGQLISRPTPPTR